MQGIFADSAVFRENLSLKRRKISMFGENSLRGAQGIISRAQGIISALPLEQGISQIITGCLCDRPTALRACCLGGQVEYTRSAAKRRC
jgi:hypothetical protein